MPIYNIYIDGYCRDKVDAESEVQATQMFVRRYGLETLKQAERYFHTTRFSVAEAPTPPIPTLVADGATLGTIVFRTGPTEVERFRIPAAIHPASLSSQRQRTNEEIDRLARELNEMLYADENDDQ